MHKSRENDSTASDEKEPPLQTAGFRSGTRNLKKFKAGLKESTACMLSQNPEILSTETGDHRKKRGAREERALRGVGERGAWSGAGSAV